ncbi:hypothetical protein BDZ91DRAFT_783371 [Kalaharituber pfeilii]|nr:hypothetical protein BDZ91DRAFT_783371 [Kalaharituber pfeilii]
MPEQPGPQAQKLTGRVQLVNAVDAFSRLLLPDERKALTETETPGNILELTKALRDARVSERNINRCEAFLQSVQQFSSIVDTMVQHNACLSALVWGSVKVLLLELQDLWPHYQGLKDAVLGYFAQTVEFCTGALAFLRRSSSSMIWRAFLLPLNNELQDVEKKLIFQQKIVEFQVILAREDAVRKARQQQMLFNTNWEAHRDAELQEWTLNRHWRRRLEASAIGNQELQLGQLKKTSDQWLDFKLNQEAQKRRQFTGSYKYKQSYQNTGRWLYEMEEYKEWIQSCHSSILWCHGIPGSGKSVLSTSVVKHLLDTCVQHATIGSGKTFIGYFFCTFSDPRSLKFEEIIRSLIKQILSVFHGSAEFEEYLARFFDQCNNLPSMDLWQDLFIRTCRLPNYVYLILDGIDECHDDIQAQLLEMVNMLLSTPREVYLRRNLTNAITISLDDIKWRPEIEGYIDGSLKQRLNDGRLQIQDPAMIEEIKQALMRGVEGMQLNDKEIRETLRLLPRNLDETYIRMLQRIVKERKKDIAVEAFRWLTKAKRRLSLCELVEAVVIRDNDSTRTQGLDRIPTALDKVIEACGNFLVIEEPVCDSSNDLQTQLQPATAEPTKQKPSMLSMPVSHWIPPELQSNCLSTIRNRYRYFYVSDAEIRFARLYY